MFDQAPLACKLGGRMLRQAGSIDHLVCTGELEVESGGGALLDGGRLVAAWSRGGEPAAHAPAAEGSEPDPPPGAPDGPLPRELADEVLCVAVWIERRVDRVRLVSCDGELAWPAWRIPGPERPPS